MPYFEIKAFEAGIDLRKASLNAPAGTLRTLKNAVVGPGGEIEKSYSMRQFTLAPAATRDLLGDSLYVYTVVAAADGVGAMPTPTSLGVITLPLPAGSHIKRVLDWDRYNNKFYIVVEAEPSLNALHFYDGVLVASVPSSTLARNIKTHKSKMYRTAGPAISFSAVGNPADNTGTGSGSITIAAEDTDMQTLVALEVYYDKLAIISQYATQLWTMDPDPSKNQFQQTLRQAGTIAPRSVKQYGSGDVLYVAGDGIRSLKAKDQSLAAAVSDIGSPIDSLIQNLVRTKGIVNYMGRAVSLIEPYSGRFWVVLPDQILILSAFPTPRITAWSIIVPKFVTEGKTITGATVAGDRIAIRASDDWVYIYGNAAGIGFPAAREGEETPQETRAFLTRGPTVPEEGPTLLTGTDIYTDQLVDIEFPFLAMEKPATFKNFIGIDVSCEGTWELYAAFDPGNPTAEEFLGTVVGPTFPARRFAMTGYATHCSLRLRNRIANEKAILSSVIVHYELAESE